MSQRAAMQAAHDALAIAQNNLAASRESAIAFDDGDLWDKYQRAMDGITSALAEKHAQEDVPFLDGSEILDIAASGPHSDGMGFARKIEQAVRKKYIARRAGLPEALLDLDPVALYSRPQR